jgi:hypothetical protein
LLGTPVFIFITTSAQIIFSREVGSAFLFLLLAVFSGFNCLLSALISSKRKQEGQRLLSGSSFGFKENLALFLLFKFGDCSAISSVVVALVTIVTSHVGPLMILRQLAYTTGNKLPFLLSTGSEEGLGPLVRLIFSQFSKHLK